ncbi:MAG TPA: hypothetical protein DD490_09840 [Acidobacteria bacterium]|nr:hypothetical protein [Acidobacteriota bacterium]
MHKTTIQKSCIDVPQQDRLLARVLAEDLRQIGGRDLGGPFASLVTGEVRRDWSDPEFEGSPSV